MNVKYLFDEKELIKDIEKKDIDFSAYLLSDKNGSYFSQGLIKNSTFYQGFVCQYSEGDEWTMFKFIERIDVVDEDKEKSPEDKIHIVNVDNETIETEKVTLEFQNKNTILIKSNATTRLRLFLDPRKIYDFSEFGRIIKIYEEKINTDNAPREKAIIAEYDNNGYSLYLAVIGYKDFSISNEWIERNYSFDKERSGKGRWFVYNGIEVFLDGEIKIVQATSKKELEELIKEIYKRKQENETGQDCKNRYKNKKEISFETDEEHAAYCCSVKAIDDLSVRDEGIYAGYYWFFQYWTRDESISLGGLIAEEKKDIVKNVINRLFSTVLSDGRLPNRFPHAELGSADGIGWAAKRFYDAIDKEFFDEKEKQIILEKIKEACYGLDKHHTDGVVDVNGSKETWMDTTGETKDTRSGARIEMQALRLSIYKLLKENINDEKEYFEQKENELKQKINELFVKDGMLVDGLEKEGQEWTQDNKVRPNIFLAYYIYPDLVDTEVWKKTFDNALDKLWLDWGGLSTLDKDNEMFQSHYTGENDNSYHRGDSWFFVNNIAAISLHRHDNEKYKERISQIKSASIKDILEKGIMGGASEVSSANEQKPEGTWQQAWSVSTFIELIHELNK